MAGKITEQELSSTLVEKINEGVGESAQSNWDETDTTSSAYIQNKPTLANVATSGNYNDLTNKPTITTYTAGTNITISNGVISSTDTTYNNATTSNAGLMSAEDKTKLNGIASGAEVNIQSNWNETNTSSDAYIQNKPTIPTVATTSVAGTVKPDGSTITITSDGTISAVGGGGSGTSDYNSLSNKPQINGVSLSGNKTSADLSLANSSHTHEIADVNGLQSTLDDKINGASMFNELFGGNASSNQIPSGADLNDYTSAGVYFSDGSTITSTLLNCPTTENAGKLEVTQLNSNTQLTQRWIQRKNAEEWTRSKSGSGNWTTWNKIIKQTDLVDYTYGGNNSPNQISEGADLNTYNSKGVYFIGWKKTPTLLNAPISDSLASKLTVIYYSDNNTVLQKFEDRLGNEWVRSITGFSDGGTWTSWIKTIKELDVNTEGLVFGNYKIVFNETNDTLDFTYNGGAS